MSIGKQISLYRKNANMTQAQLAEALDVTFQAVSSWERDEYAPDVERMVAIAKALNTTVGRLLEEYEMPNWQLRQRLFDEDHMYTFVKSAAVAKGLEQTCAALPFAKKHHAGQVRKSFASGGSGKSGGVMPYINHPLTMACDALAMGLDDDHVIAALLLHDIVEDCNVSADELPVGKAVQEAVRLVSFDAADAAKAAHIDPAAGTTGTTGTACQSKEEAKKAYFATIATNPLACLVKCIDRVNNLSNMAMGFTHTKMIEYVVETETYIVPLLRIIKDSSPEWNNAAWLLRYQMLSLLETYKRLL